MSEIYFLYSDSEMPRNDCLKKVVTEKIVSKIYPCLKGKKYLYELSLFFDEEYSVRDFLTYLKESANQVASFSLIMLIETQSLEEIQLFNTAIKRQIFGDIDNKNDGYYSLKYALESGSLSPGVEYVIGFCTDD